MTLPLNRVTPMEIVTGQTPVSIASTCCRMAYCLDGGQTAAIVMCDQLINRPVYGQQRKISDIIYFATAMPEGG